MEFKCFVANDTVGVEWRINGSSASTLTGLEEQGIVYNDTLMTINDAQFAVIRIEPRTENNGTQLECIALTSGSGKRSGIVFLHIQGK